MIPPRSYPKLEGWLTITEVAAKLKVSRQACHKMLADGRFASAHQVGSGIKPIYIIASDEVEELRAAREERKA